MERKSRVNKYRDLRESLKDDASLPEQLIEEVVDEEDAPIPTLREYRAKQFVQEVKETKVEEASELEGITAELDSKEVEEAISRVRMTSGKGQQYNTRLDILNHIQSGVKKVDQVPIVYPHMDEVEEEVHNTEEIKPVKHMSIFFEDDEEETKEIEVEESEEIEEEIVEEEPKRKFSLFKKHIDDDYEEEDEDDYHESYEEDEEDDDYEDDDYDNHGESESTMMMKILSGLIVVLSLCLVGLLIYIIKLFVF